MADDLNPGSTTLLVAFLALLAVIVLFLIAMASSSDSPTARHRS
ncbi:MAG: hypothetical protein O6705_07455 [Actinobacteria bacterium]|nr:hypothetical protein [Actinomycetota bacterium]